MKKLLPLLIGLSLASLSLPGQAENLLQVYQQAKESNPDLRKSAADRDAAFEAINQSRGSLLPQLGLTGSYTATRGYRDYNGRKTDSTAGSLGLTQVLFDMSKWRQLNISEKKAGVQEVAYQAAEQSLMLNTATAYLNVLQSIDALVFTEANKKAVYKQLDQVTQQFNVGLTAITDVQNARAQYDQVLANEVTARNNLNNALETLRQVSGVYYPTLSALDVNKFKTAQQGKIDALLQEAEQRNLSLLTARLSQDVSREQIKLAQTGHMPTLSLSASTGVTKQDLKGSYYDSIGSNGTTNNGQTTVGVNLSVPIYAGGTVNSQVKQAQYNFVSSSEGLESTHRSVVNTVRSSYNNIQASVSTIKALQQSVVSAQSSLDATEAGYQVGTRTIVDVLSATTTLYNAKQQLSAARYGYLINILTLKSALGTLNQDDLAMLNNDLGENISTQSDIIAPITPDVVSPIQ